MAESIMINLRIGHRKKNKKLETVKIHESSMMFYSKGEYIY